MTSRSLGEFEQLLLFAVLRLGEDAYGARIRQEIEERVGRHVSAGAVYTGLDRLLSRGLISAFEGDPTAVRGGRRKKFYRLEPSGATSLAESFDSVRTMADGVLDRMRDLAAAEEA